MADILTQAGSTTARFGNIVDGDFLPKQPRELFDSGDVAKVPYLLGSNTDEGTLFTLGMTVSDEDALKTALTKTFPGADLGKILEVYPLSAFADEENPAQAALARIVGDAQLVCSTWDTATRMQKLGGGVWMYNFDVPVVIASMPNLGLGASHGSELVYLFKRRQRSARRKLRSATACKPTGRPSRRPAIRTTARHWLGPSSLKTRAIGSISR